MSDPIAKCDGCGAAARRRPGFLCPDFWHYLKLERKRSIFVAWACSDACRDGLWRQGAPPLPNERCTGAGCRARPGDGWWFFVRSTSQTTGEAFFIWSCPACRDKLWQRGPGPGGTVDEAAHERALERAVERRTPTNPPVDMLIVCAEHDKRHWSGHFACAGCDRAFQTSDSTAPNYLPEVCPCRSQNAPDASQPFTVRPICDLCYEKRVTRQEPN